MPPLVDEWSTFNEPWAFEISPRESIIGQPQSLVVVLGDTISCGTLELTDLARPILSDNILYIAPMSSTSKTISEVQDLEPKTNQ